jgi:hypothetical protein
MLTLMGFLSLLLIQTLLLSKLFDSQLNISRSRCCSLVTNFGDSACP